MGVYEITTDDGVYEVTTEDDLTQSIQDSTPTSAYDYTMGGLKGLAKAGTDVLTAPADLLYRGGNYLIDAVGGSNTDLKGTYPSDYSNQFLEYLSGGEGNKTTEDLTQLGGNLATVIANPSQAQNIASKIPFVSKLAQGEGALSNIASLFAKGVGYGAEGAGYSALMNPKSDKLGEEMVEGAAMNTAIPALFKVAGKTASTVSNFAKDAGRKLELNAYGATKARIARAYEKAPEVLDEMGRRENPIQLAIEAFKRDGGGKGALDGQALIDEVGTQYAKYTKELTDELAGASARQADPIIPNFKITQEYIKKLSGAEKQDALDLANDLIGKTLNNTDGTLSGLQAEKVALRSLIKDSAYGTNVNPTKTNVLKHIRSDLRQAIEDGYAAVTGNSPQKIKQLNQEIGYRETLEPLLEDLRASDEARNVLGSMYQTLRTSGGIGQSLIAGAAATGLGGAPLAVPAIAGNLYLQTPQGKRALADGLRSKVLQVPLEKAAQGITSATTGAGRAAAALSADRPQEPAQEKTAISDMFKRTSMQSDAPITKLAQDIDEGKFVQRASEVAENLGVAPEALLRVMHFETGGTFDPAEKNRAGSGATGLIQFMPKTAKGITGAPSEKAAIQLLESMSATEQLDYVEKHLSRFKGKIQTLEDLYMAILYPKAVGADPDYKLFEKGTQAYWQNRGLDLDEDGVITKSEAARKVTDYKV